MITSVIVTSESKVQPLGARPPIISSRLQSVMWTPRGPGSSLQMPHLATIIIIIIMHN